MDQIKKVKNELCWKNYDQQFSVIKFQIFVQFHVDSLQLINNCYLIDTKLLPNGLPRWPTVAECNRDATNKDNWQLTFVLMWLTATAATAAVAAAICRDANDFFSIKNLLLFDYYYGLTIT